MSNDISILWFRKDLRLLDNEALLQANKHKSIIPIFIFDYELEEYNKIGKASLWWLENSLKKLNLSLANSLMILEGRCQDVLISLCTRYKIKNVYWNRCYEPDRINLDTKIKIELRKNNINAKSFNSSLLWEPWQVKNKIGGPYKVFTPFYKTGCLQSTSPRKPLSKPKVINFFKVEHDQSVYKFKYNFKKPHWSDKFKKHWSPGENGALERFDHFIKNGSRDYAEGRNFPNKDNVSRISPHIHWGEISPFYIWDISNKFMHGEDKEVFLSEIGWREFSHHLLYHFPKLNKKNLKESFDGFKWTKNHVDFDKWKLGLTGYPIVDAGMRELWDTGYMHNRIRMITASFLVKNLLTHWKHGERWFWDCLLDADFANNSASWQWIAGTGTDAAPFFRIFNPITQAEKFDNNAQYIKKYLPELANIPNKYIFSPWTASSSILAECGVRLGESYPFPIIDYKYSRNRALETYNNFRKNNSQ